MNAGIRNATGLYFKVVDSDDWVDWNAYQAILAKLREIAGGSVALDMLLANYVYEKEGAKHKRVMRQTGFRKIRSLPGVMCGIFIKDITY